DVLTLVTDGVAKSADTLRSQIASVAARLEAADKTALEKATSDSLGSAVDALGVCKDEAVARSKAVVEKKAALATSEPALANAAKLEFDHARASADDLSTQLTAAQSAFDGVLKEVRKDLKERDESWKDDKTKKFDHATDVAPLAAR